MSLEVQMEEAYEIKNCLFDNNPIFIPKNMLDERKEIKKEYHGKTLENGIYISPSTGAPYCRRECLTHFCED